jgi:hypothetical protein
MAAQLRKGDSGIVGDTARIRVAGDSSVNGLLIIAKCYVGQTFTR